MKLKNTPRITKWNVKTIDGVRMLVCECGYTHPYPKIGCYGWNSPRAILGQVGNICTHHEKHSPKHKGMPLPWHKGV